MNDCFFTINNFGVIVTVEFFQKPILPLPGTSIKMFSSQTDLNWSITFGWYTQAFYKQYHVHNVATVMATYKRVTLYCQCLVTPVIVVLRHFQLGA